jgi:hypothetical protein
MKKSKTQLSNLPEPVAMNNEQLMSNGAWMKPAFVKRDADND